MKKKDAIFLWITVVIVLFAAYKILEFNEKCKKGYKRNQKEMREKGTLDKYNHVP